MINLGLIPIEFPCPKCGFYNRILFRQVKLRDVVICRGCKRNIHLDDHMNECRKAEHGIRRAIQSM